jgi:hypothetical protein
MEDKRWRPKKFKAITPEILAASVARTKVLIEKEEKARKEAIEAARLIEEKQLLIAREKAEEEARRKAELEEIAKKSERLVQIEMRRIERVRLQKRLAAELAHQAMMAAQERRKKEEAETAKKLQEIEDRKFVVEHSAVRQLSPAARALVLKGEWVPRTQRLVLEGNAAAFRYHWESLARGKKVEEV